MSEPQPSGRFEVRLVQADDVDALHALVVANREHLAPWEPLRDESFYTLDHQASVVRGQLERHARGQEHPFVMTLDTTGTPELFIPATAPNASLSADLSLDVDPGIELDLGAARPVGRVAGFSQIVEESQAGCLFDDEAGLRAAIAALAADAELRDRMGASGRAALAERWTETTAIDEWLALVRSIAVRKGQGDTVRKIDALAAVPGSQIEGAL